MLDPHLALIKQLLEDVAQLKSVVERVGRPGTVTDVDYSDATKPRIRMQIGKNSQGQPVKSPWIPASSKAGALNEHAPLSVGQQVLQFAPDGNFEMGIAIPLGHSQKIPSPDTDPNTHVAAFGKTKRTLKTDSLTQTVGGTQVQQTEQDHKVTAPGKVEITAGDPSAANSSGFGSLTNAPHELNRILQGFAGRLDQHDHHVAALHDTMSKLNTIAQTVIPPLQSLDQFLLSEPENLKKAADAVLSKLPDYSSQAIQQTLAKLLNTPLGSVVEIAQGDIAGLMNGLIGQIGTLIGGAGLAGGQAATAQMFLGQAQAAVQAAAAGGNFELDRALTSLTSLAAASPAASMLGDAIGQLRTLMGSTSTLMAGLSGLLDGQVNATKGTIKSALFGGY